MKLKLFVFLFHLILVLYTAFSEDVGKRYALHPKSHPYLALIEVKQEEGSADYYCNGVFVSLRWVMTDSQVLAQEPTGRPRNDSMTVFGGFSSFKKIGSAPKKKVKKIVTDMMGSEDNKRFPNLVLILLESAFPKSSTLQSAVFNTGMLSSTSHVIGWAWNIKANAVLSVPVSFPVNIVNSKKCSKLGLLEFEEQFCISSSEFMEFKFRLLDGALLVDRGRYITGMLQYTSFMAPPGTKMPVMVVARLTFYKTFWQFHVVGSKDIFLQSDYNDDLVVEPWNDEEEEDAGLSLFSLWIWVLDSSLLVILFFLQIHYYFLLS